ncbi:4'-phosphopantetheinyl transferase superfamily protein [Cellulomonas sp. HZM]|uniref:4'-phosphopantetheinyl transferase family protein n=1 Tax=Cellulomonas sp. HZM TaxID=1454010 RepID=UPI00069209F8|nr:4'-phosphopantetheinyl transferase superfamily protein [Cellulomonas sp. HZM]
MSERVVVRFVRTDDAADDRLLTPAERTRRDRLVHPADRAAFTAAHVLVRECAATALGIEAHDVDLVQRCDTCGARGHGRPALADRPDVGVSLSHTRGWVAAIAALRAGSGPVRVGIDVELVRPVPASAFSVRERRWLRGRPENDATALWTRKEALVKSGAGSLEHVRDLDVLGSTHRPPREPARTVEGREVHGWSGPGVVGAWASDLPLT